MRAVATEGSPDFVPVPERVAVFDNDGTLWCEIPTVQLVFALDRVKALAPQHPDWRTRQPFKAALDGDMAGIGAAGQRGLVELVMATHAGMSTEAFARLVADWIGTARHPKFQRPYTRTVYQPMLEVLALLRGHGFRSFIVSGGGVEFMRVFAEPVYGVPPEQVIGSTIRTEFHIPQGSRPELLRLPEMDFVDDGPGKPVAINRFIGRRPIAAFGNSDGDMQMLQYVTGAGGRRLGLLVHHDDAAREVAYDRQSPFGRLDRALDAAPAAGWSVVSIQREWQRVFPDD
ncbi:haloacid dehalogenase-like hydrolase [Roseomonas sp. NAR14]|uniref:Haloacid dehalogenase-like hydrolase n=1 Tax=Roseomonas acroporae TaxID=2937791 RepID=A0A9X1YAA8_9PROT|nr:haloacid dehalogenase-like hydrolase [Roseomonas acroporae]